MLKEPESLNPQPSTLNLNAALSLPRASSEYARDVLPPIALQVQGNVQPLRPNYEKAKTE